MTLGKMTVQTITKVQELMHTTRVEDVMARNVIIISPTMTVSEVKTLMLDKHISGAPVVTEGHIVGMLTMTDILRAMEKGRLHEPVSEFMTTKVRTVLKESVVAEVANTLGLKGASRLPVVDQAGNLVGIVTTGTLTRHLLRQLDQSLQKKESEKLHTYRASHIFQDIVSDDTSLILRFVVDDKDFANAGKASSMIKRALQRLVVDPQVIRRVAVAVYEAEMNLVIHTDVGGEITADIRRDKLSISAVDHGPGIEDLKQVLQPGFSTAPAWIRDMGFGAGMGLANIKRVSDMMKLISEPGGGTRLDLVFNLLASS